jgi:STE24 endopeptidase
LELINILNPYTKIFISLLSIKILVQNYLDLRQKKSLKKNIHSLPKDFAHLISSEEHEKATKYNLEKLAFGKIVRSYRLMILLLWTLGGGLEYLAYLTINYQNSLFSTGRFFLAFIVIETILSLPISAYSTFKIEQKYGFNKTTKAIFFGDLFKSILLMLLLALPLYLGMIQLLEIMGKQWWVYAWAVFVFFQLTLVFVYPKFIAPLFNKFSLITDEDLSKSIKELLQKVDFDAKEIFTMDASKRSTHGNAYFTGFGKNKRIVFFDTILDQMNTNEILAILAHELGHFKKKHILKSMVISILLMLATFYFLSVAISSSTFMQGHGLNSNIAPVSIILFSMIAPIYSFLITPLGNVFSRKNEFEADDFACEHTSANDLKSALVKLYKFNYGALTPDEVYSSFYDSHPPAMIRMKNLDKNNVSQDS